MAAREILQFPDSRLRRVSEAIDGISDELRQLARDLCDVMYAEPGVGLAAPQVGEAVRLIVVDTEWTEEGAERSPLVLVNPEIVDREGTIVWTEGCLSVPDFQAEVERSRWVRVRALDLDGNEIVHEGEELRAVCFQHEIDHLDGVLFIDRISRLKRSMYVKRRKKALRQDSEQGESSPAPSGISL